MRHRLDEFRQSRVAAYCAAALLVLLAFLVRFALDQVFGSTASLYLPFFLATVASAAIGGLWPGVAATVLGALLARLVDPSPGFFLLLDPMDPHAVWRFLISGTFVSYVCELLLRAKERAVKAEQELLRSNRELEQFAFVASHDMQEPLRTVKVHTQLLLRKVENEDYSDLTQSAGFVRDGVVRMERQIQDLLTYSRVLHTDFPAQPVNTEAIAREALQANQALVEETGADVVIDPLPGVMAQEIHVLQLFQNLIGNALKYRRDGVAPQIRISAEVRNHQAVILVADNGVGFDPNYSDRIFRLFTRLHGNKYPGTGIGLAICKRIVEQYGGRIWAESTPGEGSKFYIALRTP